MDEALPCGGYMACKFLIYFAAEDRHAVRFSWSNAVGSDHNIVEYDILYTAKWQVLTNYIAKAPQTYHNRIYLLMLSLLRITHNEGTVYVVCVCGVCVCVCVCVGGGGGASRDLETFIRVIHTTSSHCQDQKCRNAW